MLPSDEASTSPLQRATRIVLAVLSVQVAAVVVTGVALFFWYRPIAFQAWSDIRTLASVRPTEVLRLVHLLSSLVVLPTAVTAGLLVALGPDRRPQWVGWVLSPAMGVAASAAFLIGFFLLRWDQLALWVPTLGTETGFQMIFDKQVRFVLMNGVEFDPGTVARRFVVHVVLGAVLFALVVVAWRRSERRPQI